MDGKKLAELSRSTPNRGNVHVFLGAPAADLCDVTTVEPGNTYSPGVWTCGISLALLVGEEWYLPDRLADSDIQWGFADRGGFPPLLKAAYSAGNVQVTYELCHLGSDGAEAVDFNRVALISNKDEVVTAAIVVKNIGPAGGVISNLEWLEEEQILVVNKNLRLVVETPHASGQIFQSSPEEESPTALLFVDLPVQAGLPAEIRFKTEHGFDDRWFTPAIPKKRPFAGLQVEQAFIQAAEAWRKELPARVFGPDPRLAQVWEACAYHILAAMELNLPRIGAVNYPIFWMRDGIIILRALDMIGRHDLARIGSDYIAPLDFSGGFGAESDAPGEGIWALTSHARLNPDPAWLQSIFPHIQRRVGWLERMLSAQEPIRALTENRTATTYNTPASTILCLAARNGCIHGRMDGHSPDFYINCWALAGFKQAAWAARQLGETSRAETWEKEAVQLEKAAADHLIPRYGNERDPVVSPYPTGAFAKSPYREMVREHFIQWYRANRLDEQGRRKREPLWTYFEAAQIHNAILFGFVKEAWECLEGMLADACFPWNIAAWIEGPPGLNEQLPFANNHGERGWLQTSRALGGNMPHNWTSGEMLALLRTIFVREEGDHLVLGSGVPDAWLKPGSRYGVQNMPTEFGLVSYTVTVDEKGVPKIEYEGPQNYQTAW